MTDANEMKEFGPWSPGIKSQLPTEFRPLSTMFASENVSTSLEQADELSDFSGIPAHQLVKFRPERLIVHELLIRVTADISVPDGMKYADLGINFRQITSTILDQYIVPFQDDIQHAYRKLEAHIRTRIEEELDAALGDSNKKPTNTNEAPGLLRKLFGSNVEARREATTGNATREENERKAIANWHNASKHSATSVERSCFSALFQTARAIINTRGRLLGDRKLLTDFATTLAMNECGSDAVGAAIEPPIREAVDREGYKLLPPQKSPVIMNVKGASAAGKSTIRPLQRKLAERLNTPWADFALISPDIWRKFLLDYESLGPATRYAGTLTGHELEIIDQKLDRYMASKAEMGEISHLLIDRFRFDSFASETDSTGSSKLLTRFGELVYMFFMITPPDATVERAFTRGLKFGRYKAVDDLLDHNVEAYTGMPELFFTWALRHNKRIHFEFLDNSVPEGFQPRTVAFGWNGEMNILDIKSLLDIDRFRRINIHATSTDEVYRNDDKDAPKSIDFLKQCATKLPGLNFAAHETGAVYARIERGQWIWADPDALAQARDAQKFRTVLNALGSNDLNTVVSNQRKHTEAILSASDTLGAWGRDNQI